MNNRRLNDLAIAGGVLAGINGVSNWYYNRAYFGYGRKNIKPGTYLGTSRGAKKIKNMPPVQKRGRSRTPKGPRAQSVMPTPQTPSKRSRVVSRSVKSRSRSASRQARSRSSRSRSASRGPAKAADFDTGVSKGKKILSAYYSKEANKAMKYGITGTTEYSLTGTDPNCVYVGHATCTQDKMIQYAATALYKMIAFKMGFEMLKGSDIIGMQSATGTVNQTLRFAWYVRDESTGTLAALSVYDTTATTTWNDAISALGTALQAMLTTAASYNQNLYKVEVVQKFTEDAATVTYKVPKVYDLTQAKISYHVKSILKVQNTTVASGDTDPQNEFNVNREPIIGKKYYGKYGGTTVVGAAGQTERFFSDQANALIAVASTTGPFREPPPKAMFTNVYKETGIEIEPGSITNDVLEWKQTMKLNFFLRGLNKIFSTATYNYQIRFGKFTFFGLEKKINQGGNNVSIRLELQQTHNVVVKCKKVNLTQPFVVIDGVA